MSSIAEILLDMGFVVSGSDSRLSQITRRLEGKGASVSSGHAASNVHPKADLVVYSSAIKETNPEIVEAKRRGIPVVRRAEVLAELMRLKFAVGVAGSHGKTTTTNMIAAVLEHGGLDPTVIIGGQLQTHESGARTGKSDYLVAETDESDRSFLLLSPTIAVVTNIDSEHLGAYKSYSDLISSFEQFTKSTPFYGLAVLCVDCPQTRDIYQRVEGRKISFGLSPDATLRATDIVIEAGISKFKVLNNGEPCMEVSLPLPGRHFVSNSLAAVAVGLEFGLSCDVIADSLSKVPSVKRRCEKIANVDGVEIISDYGHHPTEIRATIEAVRSGFLKEGGKLHVIFQPHRYSRTRDCFREFLSCFDCADTLILSDIYAASEEPIEGISGESLFDAIIHANKNYVALLEAIPERVASYVNQGDIILCLGAGSIGQVPSEIERYLTNNRSKVKSKALTDSMRLVSGGRA